MRRHKRLGDLIGTSLLAGGDVRLAVNQVGDDIQLVRMGANFRAEAEIVPPDDRDDRQGWIRAAERAWNLRGLEWRFEHAQEAWARWHQARPEDP